MAEVAGTCESHGQVSFIGGGNDFSVAHGSSGLNDCRSPRLCRSNESIGEGEEGITANNTSPEIESSFTGFPNGNAAGIHTAHLSGADPKCAIVTGKNDGI